MITDTLVLILLGWNVILTYRFIKMEKDNSLCMGRILQLMARTNMLRKEGRPMTKKEAMKIADEMFDIVEGKHDD
jgi:hypothetical protein